MTDLLHRPATETSALMTEQPRFAHSVLVIADRTLLPDERLKANYIKQLDPVRIHNAKGSLSIAAAEDIGAKKEGDTDLHQHQQSNDEAAAAHCCQICHRAGHTEAEHFRQKNATVETIATAMASSCVEEQKSVDRQGTDERSLQHHRYHHQRVHAVEQSGSDIPRERPWFASTPSEDRGGMESRTATATRQPQTQLVEEHYKRIIATQNDGQQVNQSKELRLNSGQEFTERNYRHRSIARTTAVEAFPSERREKLQRSSSSHASDATIAEAIRILEASCRMLNDSTAKYAQRQQEASSSDVADQRHIFAPSANVHFHSMSRASNACSSGGGGGRVFPRNESGYRSLGGGTSDAYDETDAPIGSNGSVTRTMKILRQRITVEHF